jgi:hypothetical protein
MSTRFQFDVFVGYSSKDKWVVRPLAERLRDDRLRLWFDNAPSKGSLAQFFCVDRSGL